MGPNLDRETIIRAITAGLLMLAVLMLWHPVGQYLGLVQPAPQPGAAVPHEKAPAARKTGTAASGTAATGTSATASTATGTSATGTTATGTTATGTSATLPAEKPPEPKALTLKAVEATSSAGPVVFGSARYHADEQQKTANPYDLEGEAESRGGGLARLTLARHDFFRTVEDRYLPPDERAAMDLIEPMPPPLGLAFTIPEIRVRLKGSDTWSNFVNLADKQWNTDAKRTGPMEAAYWINLCDGEGRTLLTVRKCFVLRPREPPEGGGSPTPQYDISLVIELVPTDDRVEKVDYTLQGPPPMPKEGSGQQDFRQVAAGVWAGPAVQVTQIQGSGITKAAGTPPDAPPTKPLGGADLAWVGQVDKYFAIIIIPQPPSPPPARTFASGAEAVQYKVTEGTKPVDLAGVRVLVKDLALDKPEARTNTYTIFAGPKDPACLERGEYGRLGLPGLITWASACCYMPLPGLQQIGHGLVIVLLALHAVVQNYGLAIILLVVILKAGLHPVTRWSYRSMAEMQKLQPRMQEIREQYKDDPKRMQEEMAKIGGPQKMLSGCLPMFVQMPIWIGLYGALSAAIQLRHAAFLPSGWLPAGSMFLQDLASPDALFHWQTPFCLPGQEIPLFGWLIGGLQGMLSGTSGIGVTSFNILPIFMGVAMYLQQKLTPQPPATTPQADQQRKMMSYMMIFFTVLLYSAPSGLCLYIATSSFLGFFEQRYLKKRMALVAAAAAQAPAEAKAPPPPARPVSRVGGREKSLADRIRSFIEQRLDSAKKQAEDQIKKKRRR